MSAIRTGPRFGARLTAVALIVLLAVLLLFTAGCAVPSQATDADRATYHAIAPEYLQYVESDPKLTEQQRARRARTIETWRLRVERAGTEAAAAD